MKHDQEQQIQQRDEAAQAGKILETGMGHGVPFITVVCVDLQTEADFASKHFASRCFRAKTWL